MQRVMDLAGWPPKPNGGTIRGDLFPSRADQVTIERVVLAKDENLTFTCRFKGRSIFYSFPQVDKKTGQKVSEILYKNIGNTLLSIGPIEIPPDAAKVEFVIQQ